MSITFNGTTQCAFRAEAPSAASYVMAGWIRRNTDSGAVENFWSIDDGTFFNATVIDASASDELRVFRNGSGVAPIVNPVVLGTWYWVMVRYTGNVMTVRSSVDGTGVWQTNVTASGLTDHTPNALTLGAAYGAGTPSGFSPSTCALMKVWSGGTLPTDTEVLAERLAPTATVTTGLWARYVFASGALGADSSGNSRPLTLTAAPTFSADNPTDLAGAPTTPTVSSIAPTSGPIGTQITITGTNLGGTSAVSINGTACTGIINDSATQVRATIASGTTTGALALTATAGSVTGGPTFTVTGATPVLTSLVLTNANVEHTLGVALLTFTVTARDQFGATFLGAIPAGPNNSAGNCGVLPLSIRTIDPITEAPFVSGVATFSARVPIIPAIPAARGFRVLMLHYTT